MEGRIGETEVEVSVAAVEARELGTTEQEGTEQAWRSVLGLVGSSIKGTEESHTCSARLPLVLQLGPVPPETGERVPGEVVKIGGSGDSTAVV